MEIKKFRDAAVMGLRAFNRSTPRATKNLLAGLLTFVLGGMFILIGAVHDAYKEVHMTPTDHLRKAKLLCPESQDRRGVFCQAYRQADAESELRAIRSTAPEYSEGNQLLSSIKTSNRKQMEDNFSNVSHDIYRCAHSTEGKLIVSFDDGNSWWIDDGRCAARMESTRDREAESSSYWPTTLRVDTDMNSSWLSRRRTHLPDLS